MTKQEHGVPSFSTVARRVVARLFMAEWFRLLGRSALGLYPAAAVLAVCLWYCGFWGTNLFGAIALIFGWLALTCLWAWLRRPSPQAALAHWDEDAGRDEMFMSAYCFESLPGRDAGEQLHVNRAAARLSKDVANLPRDLPTPLARRAWLLPLGFIGVVGLLLVPATPAEEARTDEAARVRAQDVATTLDGQTKLIDKNEGLTPDEEEKLEKLEQSVKDTADKLRKLDNETHRDVLAELEARAHEAEQLAESMDGAAEETLSSKMLEELARHADTTDFASAMQAKDLKKGSQEAKKLGDRLDHKDLSLQARKRIEHALDKSLDAATKEDKKGLVGKHLQQAHKELQKNKPKQAADKFQRLSKQLDRAKQRQLAKQRLEQLAQQLRNSGQQIFGRDPSQIRRLTQNLNAQQGLQQLGAQQLNAMRNITLQQRTGTAQHGKQGRIMIAAQPGQNQKPPNAFIQGPIPGSNMPVAQINFPNAPPGSGQCPIPGTGQCPGQGQYPGQGQSPGQGQGLGQGQGIAAPVPGTLVGQGAGDGGHHAGHGTAPYGNTSTNPLAATGTGVVDANVSGEGPSQVRNIEGGMHREETSRRAQDIAIEFIKTEEEALAEEPLPLSRRQQVLRYFTALRRQLVERESAENSNP